MGFTNDDILVLARAGFTAQQIGALNSIQTPIPTSTQQVQTPVQMSTPTLQTPVVQTSTQHVQTPVQMSTQEDMLGKILGAIQTNAINQTSQPERQTTDDILAEIINPQVKE